MVLSLNDIKINLDTTTSVSEKIELLRKLGPIEDVVIITAGPSLKSIDKDLLRKKLAGKLVIAVKQAYYFLPELVDIHLLNAWRYEEYQYLTPAPIVLMSRNEKTDQTPDNYTDPLTPNSNENILFYHVNKSYDQAKMLAKTGKFEQFLFENTISRPWGPGIMYELGFYTALLFQPKRIITLGWDIGERGTVIASHYYDKENPILKRIKSFFMSKEMINKTNLTFQGEIDIVADSTEMFYSWLKSKHVELFVISDKSIVSPVVPRMNVVDL